MIEKRIPEITSPLLKKEKPYSYQGSSSSSKRIPLTPGRDREIFPPATADSQSHRQEQTQVGSVSACILALFSPPGQWRSVSARTAPRLDQKLCGHHDRPVQSLSLLSLSFFVFRRARPIRLAPSRSLALSRAAPLSFLSLSPSPSRARLPSSVASAPKAW